MNVELMSAVLLTATIVSLISPLGWRLLLKKAGIFDVPNHRSSHNKPTLRGGGLAPMTGMITAGIAIPLIFSSGRDLYTAFVVISFSLLICWVGLIEDIRGIPTKIRAFLQLAFGLALGISILSQASNGWVWIPLIALFYAANVNFVNFMDGVNGISGMFAVVVGVVYGIIGWAEEEHWLIFCGLLIVALFAPFLGWNLTPPGMFLGDVGSYLLGGLTAAIVIAGIGMGINPIAMLAPVSIYWVDTVSTLFRRALTRQPLLEPHRSHIYQQLTDKRLSHLTVAAIAALYSAVAAAVGLISLSSSGYVETIAILAALVFIWGAYIALPVILKSRKALS
ncbi:glycosyltransferase, group 4 family [Corynebacterium efficiens YS-314]|uniref:Putative undecaprenyl phosphate alpha-n-acetylglucosaminyltransferase n=1 Tax=Corynebacterium efficiens (strain DSM 44549 / YS-314 / AJ 12310 / JCM 11189 / NBRC 100395) TaxID=196164 RepID=Q8FSM2_COREF|nr:glycosyltransferase family 4 protein [Corynebacterium efficiens]EEW50934.1 glycosyltransferase, group 4 family [Corynebacterium efficiens YS-314]BAC17171.1 putative undecaprenyl phosphate alpha-n-acetylglucosaminyltransferase [Corynebacterium efficiens YS-314]